MFEIDENNIPFVRTRQALLAIDLQNDFISTGGRLPVETPSDFIENISNLAGHFRNSGNDVIWIRSIFESSRAVNSAYGESEKVILDSDLPLARGGNGAESRARVGPSQRLLERYNKVAESNGRETKDFGALSTDEKEEEKESVSETFLTVEPGKVACVVVPSSPGANFGIRALQSMDNMKDIVFQKSYYSAFKDGSLVQALRAKFVTEIYICGVLTNISIFATAMDAARHGYSITIIDDCLGYRSKARHDEALHQLTELTGCDITNSKDIIQDLQHRARARQTPTYAQKRNLHRQSPKGKESSLENLMAGMSLNQNGSAGQEKTPNPIGKPSDLATIDTSGSSNQYLSSQSLKEEDSTILAKPSEAEGRKRDRVKTKIRTRRRPSKSGAKDDTFVEELGRPSTIESSSKSPTSAILQAASHALEEDADLDEVERSNLPDAVETGPFLSSHATTRTTESNALPETQKGVTLPSKVSEAVGLSLEESDPLCEGDTTIINDILEEELSEGMFEKIRDEVRWQTMSHQGGDVPRLVSVQGTVAEDGSIPIYRHPADESPPLLPFSPTVSEIRTRVEKKLGHSVNHVLIQFYRNGTDYISEHSDKTLDIVPNTFIANVSLGAQRTMVFRTKKLPKAVNFPEDTGVIEPRKSYRTPLPHNSMCKMGLLTNMRWLHGIRQDKRMASEKSEAELAYEGGRISLTFRMIGTYLDKDRQRIWGQGATGKTKEDAKIVVNGETPEAEKMIRAFGKENHSTEFDWAESYGEGFDVLHISNTPKLYLSGDSIADMRVQLTLMEHGITWTEGTLSPSFNWKNGLAGTEAPPIPQHLPVKFVDNDLSKSTVVGDIAIILYLDAVYPSKSNRPFRSQMDIAKQFTRFQQVDELQRKWRAVPFNLPLLKKEAELWDAFAGEAPFIAGSTISLVDYALIPVLIDIHQKWEGALKTNEYRHLCPYLLRMVELESFQKLLDMKLVPPLRVPPVQEEDARK